jgi:hypothetical protein
MSALSADLWRLTWGQPHIDASQLAAAVDDQASRTDELDFRTRQLVHALRPTPSQKEPRLNFSRTLFAIAALLLTGCAAPTSTAYIEIENDQNGISNQAQPVYVAPGVQILQNEYRRSSSNDGSNIIQKIKIKGPIMIVPVPAATTRP